MNRSRILVLVGTLACPALVLADVQTSVAPVAAAIASTEEGSVKSVDTIAQTFVLKVGDKEITVRTDSSTKYVLDGKDATFADVVKKGVRVSVRHEDGLASRVEATSPPKKPGLHVS